MCVSSPVMQIFTKNTLLHSLDIKIGIKSNISLNFHVASEILYQESKQRYHIKFKHVLICRTTQKLLIGTLDT